MLSGGKPELDPAGVEPGELAFAADTDEGVGDTGLVQGLLDCGAEGEVLPVQAVRRADRAAIRRHVSRNADLDRDQPLVGWNPPKGIA